MNKRNKIVARKNCNEYSAHDTNINFNDTMDNRNKSTYCHYFSSTQNKDICMLILKKINMKYYIKISYFQ